MKIVIPRAMGEPEFSPGSPARAFFA